MTKATWNHNIGGTLSGLVGWASTAKASFGAYRVDGEILVERWDHATDERAIIYRADCTTDTIADRRAAKAEALRLAEAE